MPGTAQHNLRAPFPSEQSAVSSLRSPTTGSRLRRRLTSPAGRSCRSPGRRRQPQRGCSPPHASERPWWKPVSDARHRHPPPALSRHLLSPPAPRRPGAALPPPPPPPHWHAPPRPAPALTGAGTQHSRRPRPRAPSPLAPERPARPRGTAPTTFGQSRGSEPSPDWLCPPASRGCDRPGRRPVLPPRRSGAAPLEPPGSRRGSAPTPGRTGPAPGEGDPGNLRAPGDSRTDRCWHHQGSWESNGFLGTQQPGWETSRKCPGY